MSGNINLRMSAVLDRGTDVQLRIAQFYFGARDIELRADLANNTDPLKGLSLLGFSPALNYLANTIGATLKAGVDVLPESFGPIGVGQDTFAIQSALNFASLAKGLNVRLSQKYVITSPLIFKPDSVATVLAGSDIHFSDHVSSKIYAVGNARLIAGAAMTQMLLLQFNAANSSIAPFYTTIEGITFDGANLATTLVESDFCMHVSILKNKFWRPVTNAIKYKGYGVARIRDNVFKCPVAINFSEGGGDSVIESNDFYPLQNGKCIALSNLAGNTTISNNVFSAEGFTNCVGVAIEGATATTTIRDIRILNNEFSGIAAAVTAQRSPTLRNIYNLTVSHNHLTPSAGGAVHTGVLLVARGVDNARIEGNEINSPSQTVTLTADAAIYLEDCKRPRVNENVFGNLKGPALYLKNTTDGKFSNNDLVDVGRIAANSVCVDLDAGSQGNIFLENTLNQSSAAFAQNSFLERAGANKNGFYRNQINGANLVTITGSQSVSTGQVIAVGSYQIVAGVATLLLGSSGFTVARVSAGVVQLTLTNTAKSTNYIPKIIADLPQLLSDTYATSGFRILTYNAAGVLTDPLRVSLEVSE